MTPKVHPDTKRSYQKLKDRIQELEAKLATAENNGFNAGLETSACLLSDEGEPWNAKKIRARRLKSKTTEGR